MVWTCSVCGEQGIDADLESTLNHHRAMSPACPVNERVVVETDGLHCTLSLMVKESVS